MKETFYVYTWGNNPKRLSLKGRICTVLIRSQRMNSALIQFIDNGQREIVSRNALRKAFEGVRVTK